MNTDQQEQDNLMKEINVNNSQSEEISSNTSNTNRNEKTNNSTSIEKDLDSPINKDISDASNKIIFWRWNNLFH
ncbi:19317_t:CDS:2 [Cetraspora pellucida]|uniref:19317_t:CDS:1 n=1 Tax=Cetraspora pellucida TaxID=1433469 RepID=A0A9N9A903_9GLOM|nr:19317_t:CDS:2 [Cetraspora pellucida]